MVVGKRIPRNEVTSPFKIKGETMNKLSECCNAPLRRYNEIWDDGICTKCDEHTPALKEEEKVWVNVM